MQSNKLKKILNNFQASNNSCKKTYCSTCGGIAYTIDSTITPQTNDEIKSILSELNIDDFRSLDEWCEYLSNTYPTEVRSIYERELKKIDTSNIQQLDYFLFYARKSMKNTPIYQTLLDEGINMAIKTSNDSLIETIAIVLDDEILNYEKLFQIALKKSKTNNNIHRVLYNTLRDKVVQVRNFIGNGTTSCLW